MGYSTRGQAPFKPPLHIIPTRGRIYVRMRLRSRGGVLPPARGGATLSALSSVRTGLQCNRRGAAATNASPVIKPSNNSF